jgi:hypothetical protein
MGLLDSLPAGTLSQAEAAAVPALISGALPQDEARQRARQKLAQH